MNRSPDRWVTAEQQQRLTDLMARWRLARDARRSLAPKEQLELAALVAAEWERARRRREALWGRPLPRGTGALPDYPASMPVPAPRAECGFDWVILLGRVVQVCLILAVLAMVNMCFVGFLAGR